MPATAANIALATREAVYDTRSDTAVQTRNAGARDTGDTPRAAFWDSVTDAAIVNNAAFSLIGVERRRFAVRVQGATTFSGGLDFTVATPTVTLVDAELAANGSFLISRIELDLESETTSFEVFG